MLKLLDHQLNVLSELKSIHTEKNLRHYCLLLLNILLVQLALASLESPWTSTLGAGRTAGCILHGGQGALLEKSQLQKSSNQGATLIAAIAAQTGDQDDTRHYYFLKKCH